MNDRDPFRVEGDCWCPGTMTLAQLLISGHTEACTQGRKGWDANRRHLSAIGRQRRADEAAGRQLREAAAAIVRSEAVAGDGQP